MGFKKFAITRSNVVFPEPFAPVTWSNSPEFIWKVRFSNPAKKNYFKLKKNGSKPSIADTINLLLLELEEDGPYRTNWSNYGSLNDNDYHCHLKQGRPCYVACWRILNKKEKEIEVYYVGTHENAPY